MKMPDFIKSNGMPLLLLLVLQATEAGHLLLGNWGDRVFELDPNGLPVTYADMFFFICERHLMLLLAWGFHWSLIKSKIHQDKPARGFEFMISFGIMFYLFTECVREWLHLFRLPYSVYVFDDLFINQLLFINLVVVLGALGYARYKR